MRWILARAAPLALLGATAVPATAQDEREETGEEDLAAFGSMMQGLFTAEPLTPEQEARLPQATAVVDKILPAGAYARMMEEMFERILEPISATMPERMPAAAIAQALGVSTEAIADLSEEQQAEIAQLIDPVFSQRSEMAINHMMDQMGALVVQFEPGMKRGLSKAYAKRFTADEMADIQAFFATPTGARYATESMLVFTDPQTMAGTMEALPAMMRQLPQMMGGLEEAMAALPPPRGFADLSEAERARLAALLGTSVAELEADMLAADPVE